MIYHTVMVLFLNKADMPVINLIVPIIRIQRWVQRSLQAIEAPSHTAYILCISGAVVQLKVSPIGETHMVK